MPSDSEQSEHEGRDKLGRFAEGNTLSPGRPPGVPSLQRALQKLLEDDPDHFARTVKRRLEEGSDTALRLLIERVWPQAKNVDHGVTGELTFRWKREDEE